MCNKVKESCRVRFKTGVKMRIILDENGCGAKCKDRWLRKRARVCIGVVVARGRFCN